MEHHKIKKASLYNNKENKKKSQPYFYNSSLLFNNVGSARKSKIIQTEMFKYRTKGSL